MEAVEFIVIETEISSRLIFSKRRSISSIVEIGTPDFPISPKDISSSESYPICVGKSNATDKPLTPFLISFKYLLFDSETDEKPAYCLIVHNLSWYIFLYIPFSKGNLPNLFFAILKIKSN